MTGVAKTLDKVEAKLPGDPHAQVKKKYGDKRDVDTDEGYAKGKEKKAIEQADIAAAKATADAKAAADAAAEAAVQKGQEAERDELKKKGRRASIMTSSQGVTNPLGVPG